MKFRSSVVLFAAVHGRRCRDIFPTRLACYLEELQSQATPFLLITPEFRQNVSEYPKCAKRELVQARISEVRPLSICISAFKESTADLL